PRGVEYGLLLLVFGRAHALHAAHVMNAIHPRPPTCGRLTLATASRVTRAARASSPSVSVPAGRSGSTMYRSSEVLSQTRTSTSLGSSVPSSRNTPRGSITARERYGADLYQTGGSPSTGQG